MAKTLAEIEELARYYTYNRELVLTVNPGRLAFNNIYRSLVFYLPWPEFRVKVNDTSVVTATGVNEYNWALVDSIDGGSATTAVYAEEIEGGTATDTVYYNFVDGGSSQDINTRLTDVVAIEVGASAATDAALNLMISPPSEAEWNEASKDSDGVPAYYVRDDSSGTPKVELRPAPSYDGAKIQVTGYEEPDELTIAGDTTRFITSVADDILARLIAADYYFGVAEVEKGSSQLKIANDDIRMIFGEELVPSELTMNIISPNG